MEIGRKGKIVAWDPRPTFPSKVAKKINDHSTMKTSLLHRISLLYSDSATATSCLFSTSHGSFVIVVAAPSPLHPYKFKPKVSSFLFDIVLFSKINWENNHANSMCSFFSTEILLLWFLVVVPQIYCFVHACLLGFGL
ncbi:hypothetical protein AHAS_Ahas11G0177400 [Arachis hypogaea]